LVEEDSLERRPPPCELRRQPACREPRTEGLRPVLRGEVGLEVGVLQDEPGPKPAYVAIDEPGAVVELDDRPCVSHRREPEAPGHAQMNEEPKAALETQEQVLATALDRDDAIALELLGDLEEVVWPRQPRVEDLDPSECAPE
jgi:hypothetical protein